MKQNSNYSFGFFKNMLQIGFRSVMNSISQMYIKQLFYSQLLLLYVQIIWIENLDSILNLNENVIATES
jgi:hypothetical protein